MFKYISDPVTYNLLDKYKQTNIGLIPIDWDVKPLKDVFILKNGYAFSSDYFSETGPIVITPGNFKLEGGLNFNERNTLRYSGFFPTKMKCTDFIFNEKIVFVLKSTNEQPMNKS